MVNFASVDLAPDSLQLNPDTASATVLVRVVEAPQYLAEVAGGYGTIDCLRTEARRLDRNFLGGGRTLELSGSLSKVGVGEPLDAGFENSLCPALEGDTLGNVLNYRVAADFVQPRLFGTQTSTSVNLYSERISELETYLRTANGGRVSVIREVAAQTLATASVNVNRGKTEAQPVFFCFSLEVCERARIDSLQQSRWSNFFSLSLVRDRTRSDVFPTGGYQVRGSADWATSFLGSDDRYVRLFSDAAVYRQVREGWVLAGRLQGGAFLEGVVGSEGYIPPERLFYAGGPNSVRGFQRNPWGGASTWRRSAPAPRRAAIPRSWSCSTSRPGARGWWWARWSCVRRSRSSATTSASPPSWTAGVCGPAAATPWWASRGSASRRGWGCAC
jgi:outer membrane protein assembly factor BamA